MSKVQYTIVFIIASLLFTCKQVKDSNKTDVALNEIQKKDNEFLIKGATFNAENDAVYLFKWNDLEYSLIDSTTVSNNSFIFKGEANTPEMYSVSKNKNKNGFTFLVDNSVIDVFLNNRLLNSVSYSPTQVQQDYLNYTTKMTAFKDEGMSLYYDMRGNFSDKNIKALKQKRNALFSKENAFVTKFIANNPNSYYSAIIVKNRLGLYNSKTNRALYNSFSSELKALPISKYIDSVLIESDKSTIVDIKEVKTTTTKPKPVVKKKTEYRPKAYALSGKNTFGQTISLNSIPKGKVVLVDFWASWCAPCRATNPNLVRLYNKYNSQGLEILSISEDRGEPEWLSAISVDNLKWDYHILDKNKSIAFRYGVESIPFKLLIDKQGRIASEKISGVALENRIKELLKE